MSKMMSTMLLLALSGGAQAAQAGAVDADGYLRQRGWERVDAGKPLRSPVPEVAPLWFHDKDGAAPSCGLLTASAGGRAPTFIELVGSDPDAGFPQCVGVPSITRFRLQDVEYLAVEYLARETREDTDIHFHYLVRDRVNGFITDQVLTDAVPSSPSGLHPRNPVAVKAPDGVRLARIAHLTSAYPAWRFIERDFISDKTSSFSIFEDKKSRLCQFVTEAGAAPVTTAHTVFAPGAVCSSVLASARYEKGGKVVYLALFETQARQRVVGITSVSADGSIAIERALADAINRNGATQDMKAARAALLKEIR